MSISIFHRKQRGSVLLYALIVLMVGGFVLAGWMSLLGSRMIYNEGRVNSINQRIILDNSRALASQYILQNVLPGSYSTSPVFNFASLGGWGGFTLTSSGSVQTPLQSTTIQIPVNQFAPGDGSGFTVDIAASLSDGTTNYNWLFSAKSRSLIFASDLLTLQTPTLTPGTAIEVDSGLTVGSASTGGANTMIWQPDSPNTYGILKTQTYATPTATLPSVTVYNSDGSALLMSDFAFIPETSGTAGSNYGYDGSISVVNPSGASPVNSLYANLPLGFVTVPSGTYNDQGVTNDGAGNITIDVSGSLTASAYIPNVAKKITLLGQVTAGDSNADGYSALLIVVVQTSSTPDLTSIVLQGYNNRRIYLGIKKSTSATVTFTCTAAASSVPWRLAGTFENTPLTFSPGARTLAITGGIRTDQSITVSTGAAIQFYPETIPEQLDRYADRVGWLESLRQ